MLRLVIEDDEGKTTIVPLIREEITIGRKVGNTIRLTERNVSRQHARLKCDPDAHDPVILLEDLDSYSGVRVNGDRLQGSAHVQPGDLIQIGDYSLALRLDQPSGHADAPSEITDGRTVVQRAMHFDIPAEEQAHFVALSSNLAGEKWYIPQHEVLLGRTDDNELIINHRSISRNHAKVIVRDGVFTIIDLASSNGVRINGQLFGSHALYNGDIIELGQVKLRFVAPGDPYVFTPADIEDVVQNDAPSPIRGVLIASLLAFVAVGTFLIVRYQTKSDSSTENLPVAAAPAVPTNLPVVVAPTPTPIEPPIEPSVEPEEPENTEVSAQTELEEPSQVAVDKPALAAKSAVKAADVRARHSEKTEAAPAEKSKENAEVASVAAAEDAHAQDYDDLLTSAQLAMAAGDTRKAIQLFERASLANPTAKPPHSHLCHILEKQGNFKAALEHCRSWLALEKSPALRARLEKRIADIQDVISSDE